MKINIPKTNMLSRLEGLAGGLEENPPARKSKRLVGATEGLVAGPRKRIYKRTDLTGKKFGRLTVISFHEMMSTGHSRWLCRCECGNKKIVQYANLKSGSVQSCRCLNRESVRKSNSTHKMKGTSVYYAWNSMKQRCLNSSCRNYPLYGARGIFVCERWLESFENFYADMGDKTSPKHSLDRINNDGNYEPGNCRWATAKEQSNNKRNNLKNVSSTKRK